MRLKLLLRPSLAVVFGFIGAALAKLATPFDIFSLTGDYFLLIAALAFGLLGFILPELLEIAGRAGIAAMAAQIASHLPSPPTVMPGLPFRRRKKTAKNNYQRPFLIDTSVLVDGRILEVARAGFIFGTLLVMPSVIAELHRLSDSSDDMRRARGRRGLDILAQLQALKFVKSEILANEPTADSVDEKLVKLAKNYKGVVLTCDFNLAKVAKVSKVAVANINELASAVKTVVLPHQRLKILIKAKGKGKEQGVGYLADGTMVVVAGGGGFVGREIEATVEKVLQTAAGKMIFARLATSH